MTTATHLITAEQFFEGRNDHCELIEGEVVQMAPGGIDHGSIHRKISNAVGNFVDERQLGWVVGAETGFIVARNPDTVLAPDVAFIPLERAPLESYPGFFKGAPDLVVEVVSPNDRASEVATKVDRWIGAGAKSVWVVDPPNKRLDAYRADGSVQRFKSTDVVENDPGLPGFSLSLERLFRSMR